MEEEGFKNWLEQGGAQSEKGHNTRIYALRTIEKSLTALGMAYGDLAEAWKSDQFKALHDRLSLMQKDAQGGGQDYRILMPDSENPQNRLSNWNSWLRQYGRFLAGEQPGPAKDADRIRNHVLTQYIEPARAKRSSHVEVLVRDVNSALGLKDAWPNICQSLTGKKFQSLAKVAEPERIGAPQSSATIFRFDIANSSARPFILFDSTGEPFQPVKHHDQKTGISAYRIKPKGAGNKTDEAIKTEDIREVVRALLIDGLAARIQAISRKKEPVSYLTYGGGKLVRYQLDPAIAQELGIPHTGGVSSRKSNIEQTSTRERDDMRPQNIILYGPPGTGKTFATASEAVRLCEETVPANRTELMATYKKLVAAGRIEFVTFHQSMAYEDFVEGKQPVTGSDDDEDASSAGFRLEPVSGIFRRISKRAETSRGRTTGKKAINLTDRQVFKMSIGEASNPEDASLFEDAIEGGYTLLGYDNVDWSDEKYTKRDAIIEVLKARNGDDTKIDARSGAVQMPYIFRSWVKEGDIVVVTKGNRLFRAIGIFVGDYQYSPRPDGTYSHRRKVEWLWVDTAGVPVEDIYSRRFHMKPIYLLTKSELNIPALERYMNSGRSEGPENPEPFVLIIDEINRANISKVFGELITLLEPDKRLGKENALKVHLPYSGDSFGVPANLHILGTMNTADRSIALLDTALRRRFTFKEMMPDPSILSDAAASTGVNLPQVLTTINERIEYLFDREHQIGHAYFTGCKSRSDVDDAMRHKVIPLLAEYFFEDWAKIAAVLGDLKNHDGDIRGGFLNRSTLKAPPGLEDSETQARFRWQVRPEAEGFDYSGLEAG